MHNVLVTGAAMPVGERLVRTLLNDSRVGHVMAVTGDAPSTFPIPESARLSVIQVDLARHRRVHNLLFGAAKKKNIDVVVHNAMHRSAYAEGSSVHAFNVETLRACIAFSERHPTIRSLVVQSAADVYQVQRDLPILIEEDHPLNMAGNAPQWIRDRVEADVTACTRMGLSPLRIIVLRMTEVLAPGTGSQLFDYLQSPICVRPAGFDPMLNVLTLEDSALALQRAIHSDAQGVFNIPGADTLPLSGCIERWGRLSISAPSFIVNRIYRLRARITGHDFRYGMNRRRFHFSGVLDGTRSQKFLGYVPCHTIEWPVID